MSKITYMLVDNLVAVIVRDEPWNDLTVSSLKELIVKRSNGVVVPTGIEDERLKEMMKRHVCQVMKRDKMAEDVKLKRSRLESCESDEEALFPIRRKI